MRILVVGDTHGNIAWWENVVAPLAGRLEVEGIIQVGDFGYWPGLEGEAFRSAVAKSAIPVWFCDGNHEHHELLQEVTRAARLAEGITSPLVPVPLEGNLIYLPRGGKTALRRS